jgi:hypothetical protein
LSFGSGERSDLSGKEVAQPAIKSIAGGGSHHWALSPSSNNLVILGMSANPKPNGGISVNNGKSTIGVCNPTRPKRVDLLKLE